MRRRTTALDLWPESPLFPAVTAPIGLVDETDSIAHKENDGEKDLDDIGFPQNRKNLNPTCVTPLVESLARPYFANLIVAGDPLSQSIDGVVEKQLLESKIYKQLLNCLLDTLHSSRPTIEFRNEHLKCSRSAKNPWRLYSSVFLNQEEFTVGDTIIVPTESAGKSDFFPRYVDNESHPCLGDLFWFAQILSIRSDDNKAHVRWFQHGCQTILQELAHPQELFLTNSCDDINLVSILAKWSFQRLKPGERPTILKHSDLFYSLEYESKTATFKDITLLDTVQGGAFCDLCRAREEQEEVRQCQPLKINGVFEGLTLRGEQIHRADSVTFYISDDKPCGIGQVVAITDGSDTPDLSVRLYGKFVNVLRRDPRIIADTNDDRQLFLTDEKIKISSSRLINKCSVIHSQGTRDLKAWLSCSASHFFVLSHSTCRKGASQDTMKPLAPDEFDYCSLCTNKTRRDVKLYRRCKKKLPPLRFLDLFAGVGAFSLGMASTSNTTLAYAVEISPSAARTLKYNSPSTVVYNQCSNKVLDYAIKRARGVGVSLKSLEDGETQLPPPPNRGDVDCVVSGFPWSVVRDLENELFLNTVSWVEFLRPKYCLFENVEGFTSFNLKAVQKDKHKVEGGIEKGGIKLLIRALIMLGYQVSFCLKQAGEYGTPQSRVRFFLWATQAGLPLPEFPMPTHHFPHRDSASLEINFPNGDSASHISYEKGMPPLPFVTINEAISDLKRWDWVESGGKRMQGSPEEREKQGILQIKAHKDDSWCGISGEGVGYEHPPRSAYAARSRLFPTTDIQHITPIYKDDILRRVCAISLEPGADYRSLGVDPALWDMDPRSANARNGYKRGHYGRLNPSRYFNTTVTNVYVTATQSWVLNPWCKRIFSVRELARSQGFPDAFVFIALDESIKTMHKHIGNAVPWPVSEALGRELQVARFREWMESEGCSTNFDE